MSNRQTIVMILALLLLGGAAAILLFGEPTDVKLDIKLHTEPAEDIKP